MRGEIHVQHKAILEILQRSQAASVAGLIELLQDISQLGLKLKELLEGADNTKIKTRVHIQTGKIEFLYNDGYPTKHAGRP